MTDREICRHIVQNCIVILKNKNYAEKLNIQHILKVLCELNYSLSRESIEAAEAFFLKDYYRCLTITPRWNYTLEYSNANKDSILLTSENVLYLKEFYDKNLNTKESIEDLLNNINIKEQIENKEEILKTLYDK